MAGRTMTWGQGHFVFLTLPRLFTRVSAWSGNKPTSHRITSETGLAGRPRTRTSEWRLVENHAVLRRTTATLLISRRIFREELAGQKVQSPVIRRRD